MELQNRFKSFYNMLLSQLIRNLTWRKAAAVVVGNIILGIGAAGLRFSLMGNEPYTAVNMAMSDGFHVGLGNFQLVVNLVLLIVQLIWGRSYLGFGTIINMCFLGYVIQFSGYLMESLLGSAEGFTLFGKIVFMLVSLVVLSFGLSMYQVSVLGVSPYDYLAFGMTEHFPMPYFVNRVITDGICVLVILVGVFSGFLTWDISHLGLGTILGAFFLGPLINFFTKIHKKWIQ